MAESSRQVVGIGINSLLLNENVNRKVVSLIPLMRVTLRDNTLDDEGFSAVSLFNELIMFLKTKLRFSAVLIRCLDRIFSVSFSIFFGGGGRMLLKNGYSRSLGKKVRLTDSFFREGLSEYMSRTRSR